MNYRYYITTVDDGTVYGTNDKEVAIGYSHSEDAWVIDTKNNEWIIDGTGQEIAEVK